jgi:hypothetical protein
MVRVVEDSRLGIGRRGLSVGDGLRDPATDINLDEPVASELTRASPANP